MLEGERAGQQAAVEAAVVDTRLAAADTRLLARLRAEEASSQASRVALQKRLVSCHVLPPPSPFLYIYAPANKISAGLRRHIPKSCRLPGDIFHLRLKNLRTYLIKAHDDDHIRN